MKHGEKIKAKILAAGVKVWPDVSARRIGRELNLTHSAVLYHFGDIATLRDAVAAHAVEKKTSRVIVELIAKGHSCVAGMPQVERQRHMKAVS